METLWPIIILWIVFSLLGSRKKRPPQRVPPPEQAAGGAGRPAPGGFMQEMQRALEEMKRAAEEQQRRQQQHQQQARADEQAASAQRYLEAMKRKKAQEGRRPSQAVVYHPGEGRRTPVVRPRRPLEDDDADKSSEDPSVVSLEGVDYDADAERIVEERSKAADRGARTEGSSEELSAAQVARRAGRTPVALGGTAQHAAWHAEIGARAEKPGAAARPGRLARWADGSVKGAVVLAEILGRPGSAR